MDHIQTVPKAYDVRTGKKYTTRFVSYADIPHVIHVNWNGVRIVNSDARRDEIANAILGQPENCSFIVTDNKLLYPEGCVIKYVIRHQDKGGRQDLEKAIHYCQMAIDRDYPDV